MKKLDDETILWESKNKRLLLTTHRLREEHKSLFGSSIKSIMIEKITASELRTTWESKYLKRALLNVILLNGIVYILNHFLFESVLFQLFFDEVHIDGKTAAMIFYFSLFIAIINIILFFLSFRKVFSFYSNQLAIDFQLRWLSFEERENFISTVEQAKSDRMKQVSNR